MIAETTRTRLDALLAAVRTRPAVLPIAEVVELASEPVAVSIDRRGGEVLVVVSDQPPAGADDAFGALTDRQREVAGLVADGLSNREIADRLFISVPTVKDHVHAILARTGCRSRAAVAAAWHAAGG